MCLVINETHSFDSPAIGASLLHSYILKGKGVVSALQTPQYTMSKLTVTFLIDREEKRVVCAEAGGDFVDVLFSFLTLPLGSIVRLLGKQSGLGSLDSLYRSVEQLDMKHLQTDVCKEMLLNPRSAAAITCEDLKVKNIFSGNPRMSYCCEETVSLIQSISQTVYHSHERTCRCHRCGKLMNKCCFQIEKISECGGIFVKETVNFLITDNLRVIPASLKGGCSLFKELQIKNSSIMEKKVIHFGTQETLDLLRKLLVSKNPLTEVCFPYACLVSENTLTEVCILDACIQAGVNCTSAIKQELKVNEEDSEITLNLILNRETNSVVYADVGTDFVNQLLSFLTFPLGSVPRLLSNNISKLGGCINNLYTSVENMGLDCFKSENCRNMLLFPKLPSFYGIEKQILNMEEITPKQLYSDDRRHLEYIEQNPKSKMLKTDIGGAFVVESTRFMIADNLQISPLSFFSAISDGMNLPFSDLVEKDVCLDKAKTLSPLSTMLISKTVLTDVFMCQTKADQRRQFL